MHWVLVADSTSCKLYAFSRKPQELTLLKTLENPEGKLKKEDIVSDRPGHYNTRTSARGAYQPASDPKEVVITQFLREVCDMLNSGRTHNAYNELTIIAADRVYGRLIQLLDKNVVQRISHHINKDLSFMKPHELLPLLVAQTHYPDGPGR